MTTRDRRPHWDATTDSSKDRRDASQDKDMTLVDAGPRLDPAHAWLAQRSASPVVRISIDGQPLLAVVDVQAEEHARRQEARIGAVTSKGLLCGLWLLPTGAPVRSDQLPASKIDRFQQSRGVVEESLGGWTRRYSPAGVVRALAVVQRSAKPALRVAAGLPPIFERWVFADDGLKRPSADLLAQAAMSGVGLTRTSLSPTKSIIEASPAVIGSPGVYRWWIGEVAYAAWLAQTPSTQLSS